MLERPVEDEEETVVAEPLDVGAELVNDDKTELVLLLELIVAVLADVVLLVLDVQLVYTVDVVDGTVVKYVVVVVTVEGGAVAKAIVKMFPPPSPLELIPRKLYWPVPAPIRELGI